MQGPDGNQRPVKITDNGDGTFNATYVPDDCGRYKLDVKYAGQSVPQSPFNVQAYATGNVSILNNFIKFRLNYYHWQHKIF